MATVSCRPVIIVGAGPIGLCLSLRLAQRGIAVVLIEELTDATFLDQVPRAGTNHPATLELYQKIGLYQRLEPRGIVAPLFQYWDRGAATPTAEFDHAVIKDDTAFPFVLQCERIKVCEEGLLMVKNEPLCTLHMGSSFTGFQQSGSGVTADFTNAAGEPERVEGCYLVSCEGARSLVRKALGIDFEGFTYSDRTLNIEVSYDFKQHGFTERNYISDPVEWSNLFHWAGPPDRWRVHFPVRPEDATDAPLPHGMLLARLRDFLPGIGEVEIRGSNVYTVHQRVAARFRGGRAILCGDSAHVNSPIGAMGMNSGVHDAFNLADKLFSILHGADDTLLDRYDRQRRHVAITHTQAQTMRNKKLLMEQDPAIRRSNRDALRRSAEDPALARQFVLRTSLIDSLREAEAIA